MSGSSPPELARCLDEPGYTPPTRALDGLLGALLEASDEHIKPLERALARAGSSALRAAVNKLSSSAPSDRPRLLSLLVRLAGEVDDAALSATFVAALDEPVARSRKLAARGLGKLADGSAEGRLLQAIEQAPTVEQKGIVDALASLGGEASARHLVALQNEDADLQRRVERARLMIERRLGRSEPGRLVLDAALPATWRVALFCRAGLAEVLTDELRQHWTPEPRDATRVDVQHAGSLAELLVARTALELGLVLPLSPSSPTRGAAHGAPEQRIADALAQPACLEALAAWTQGVPRFRVSWTSAGHRRALTWALAGALRERTSALLNDSHDARWTVHAPPDGQGELLIVPRLDPDPRFAYRSGDVPAASHPTIAAALARLAGVRADDVVWDPFVGSGLELIERARLGPVRELWGSDIDPRALATARRNLDAAGLGFARLMEGSALELSPASPSLILTNPPMGRRVARDGSVGELLEQFVRHAARVLRPSGRLVWLSPLAERTERVARGLGLEVRLGPNVDLGGFSARVQIITRAP